MQVNKQRASESGGIISFVLIGLVLVSVLAGGLYLIYGRSSQVANIPPEQTRPVPKNSTEDKNTSPKTEAPKPQTPPAVTQPKQAAPAAPTTPTPAPVPTTPIASSGPTETILSTIALGAVTATTMAYVQSRRLRQE